MITQGVFLSTVWCFTSYTSHCTRPSIRIISFRKSCMKKFVSKNWFWHGSHEIFKEDLCLPLLLPLIKKTGQFCPIVVWQNGCQNSKCQRVKALFQPGHYILLDDEEPTYGSLWSKGVKKSFIFENEFQMQQWFGT